METNWLSISDAASSLAVSEPTVYRWMRDGRLSYYKIGDATRFKSEDLQLMVERHVGEQEIKAMQGACNVCSSRHLEPGRLRSTGNLYFVANKTPFFTLNTSEINTQAKLCMDCGHVNLFADLSKAKKLTTKKGKS